MYKNLIKVTSIALLSILFTSAAYAKSEEEQAREIEAAAPKIIEKCLSTSMSEEQYHTCALNSFRDLVVNGNQLASISIIQYYLEIGDEESAYQWYKYLTETDLSAPIKFGARVKFKALAERHKSEK